jgi:hypothetical protein
MFKILDDIKTVVAIVATVSTIAFAYWGYQQKERAEIATSNLYKKEIQWTDEKGRLVTEVTELTFTKHELQSMRKADKSKLTDVQLKLKDAYDRIEELGITPKDVESFNKAEFEVKYDSLVSIIEKDSLGRLKALKPIKTPNLEISFNVNSDTVLVDYKYKTNIVSVINRKEDKLTYNGNKRFILARLVNPRYEYWSTNVIDDPNAEITSDVYLNFGRHNK